MVAIAVFTAMVVWVALALAPDGAVGLERHVQGEALDISDRSRLASGLRYVRWPVPSIESAISG